MIRSTLSRWVRSCRRALRPLRRPSRRRLSIDQLEERTLLSSVTWVNPASGLWNVPGNWSTGALPGAADDVVISPANPNITITHSSGSDTIHSLTSSALVNLTGGTLTVSTTAQVTNTFTLSGGTLANATIVS